MSLQGFLPALPILTIIACSVSGDRHLRHLGPASPSLSGTLPIGHSSLQLCLWLLVIIFSVQQYMSVAWRQAGGCGKAKGVCTA